MDPRSDIAQQLGLSPQDIEWFVHFAHPEKWNETDCVLWSGAFWHEYSDERTRVDQLHGVFIWGDDLKPNFMGAHRLAYLLYRGDIQKDQIALHKCPERTNRTRGQCVNPFHIQPGTHWENHIDRVVDDCVGIDPQACFNDRHTLTVAERAKKYNLRPMTVGAIDWGDHPDVKVNRVIV